MERPLDCLNNLAQDDWLIGYNSHQFNQIAQELYLELTNLSTDETLPKIILAEREPLRFLASFIAACAANCPVFLCNHDWGTQEWQQVFDLVQPDIILGELPHSAREHLTFVESSLKPHPNPLLSKEREHKSCFPPYQGGTKGGRFRVY